MNKSVLIIHQHANPPNEPGITRHFQMAKALMNLDFAVSIVAGNFFHFRRSRHSSPSSSEVFNGVKYYWIPVNEYGANYFTRLWSMFVFAVRVFALRRPKFDQDFSFVIGSSPSLLSAFAAYWVAKRWKVPFIFEVRDLWPKTIIELGKVKPWNPLIVFFGFIERFLCRNSNHIITVLPGAIDHLVSKGAQRNKISWIPNFVDLDLVPDSAPKENSAFHAVYAGSFGLANSLDTILDAAAILKRKNWNKKQIRFTLIGDGPMKPEIENKIQSLQLDNVSLLPPLKKPDIYNVLREADVFLMPVLRSNLYKSGMSPNKLFDYMACSRPIIFSNEVEYNPVNTSGGGLCVPPEDPASFAQALIQLASMPFEERLKMGTTARHYVEKHHSLKKIQKDLFESLTKIDPEIRTADQSLTS